MIESVKRKKLPIVFLVIVMVLGLISASALASVPPEDQEVWVCVTGHDDNDGTEGSPFATIQKGIDTVAAGGTVNVATGVYGENINLNKTVTLNGGTEVTLQGAGSGNGVLVNASGVTIEGFEITNYAIGIRTYGGPSSFGSLSVINCFIHSNTQNGVLITHDTFTTVAFENCTITGNTQNGIGIADGAEIEQLTINPSVISLNGHHGLYIAGAGTTIDAMTVSDTTMTENGYSGVTIDSGSSVFNATFTGCTFTGSDVNFVVRGGTTEVNGLTLVDTTLSNSPTNHGFWLREATVDGLTFEGVSITNNHNQGFFVSNLATLKNASISGGSINENKWGFLSQDSTVNDLEVEGVQIVNNTNGSGLSVASGTLNGLTVEGCYFQNNAWEHLDLGVAWKGTTTMSNVSITGNTFRTGTGNCIWIADNATFNSGDIVIQFNGFASGAWGISNNTGVNVDATFNWWGHVSGPGGVGTGSGDAVSANVTYDPWLLSSGFEVIETEGNMANLEDILFIDIGQDGLVIVAFVNPNDFPGIGVPKGMLMMPGQIPFFQILSDIHVTGKVRVEIDIEGFLNKFPDAPPAADWRFYRWEDGAWVLLEPFDVDNGIFWVEFDGLSLFGLFSQAPPPAAAPPALPATGRTVPYLVLFGLAILLAGFLAYRQMRLQGSRQ